MIVIVIGLGSMGKRRIRLIKKYDKNIHIIGIDGRCDRRDECQRQFNIEVAENLDTILSKYTIDCAFICTPPTTHSCITTTCLNHHIHVFSELNLVSDGYEANQKLAKDNHLHLFLSSTFLYRKEIMNIQDEVLKSDCLLNYSYHTGQYLPDWHPWESYEDFFAADKRSNACREIFAIELPWLVEVFGDITEFQAQKSRISSLNIDYADNYQLILQHASGHRGVLCVDAVSRKPVRNLEIYGENLYLSWNGKPDGLKVFNIKSKIDMNVNLYDHVDQLGKYSSNIIENTYYDEVVGFFDIIADGSAPKYDFGKDKKILDLIDEIEA